MSFFTGEHTSTPGGWHLWFHRETARKLHVWVPLRPNLLCLFIWSWLVSFIKKNHNPKCNAFLHSVSCSSKSSDLKEVVGNPLQICGQLARCEGGLGSPKLVAGIQSEGSLVGDYALSLWDQCELQAVRVRIAVVHGIHLLNNNYNLHMSLDKWMGPKHLQGSLAYGWCCAPAAADHECYVITRAQLLPFCWHHGYAGVMNTKTALRCQKGPTYLHQHLLTGL